VRRLFIGVAALLAGYVLGAVASYFAILATTSNVHDRSVEAAMTSAFVSGPIAAVVALVASLVWTRR
jgi:uncharacterized membrane protein